MPNLQKSHIRAVFLFKNYSFDVSNGTSSQNLLPWKWFEVRLCEGIVEESKDLLFGQLGHGFFDGFIFAFAL